MNEANREKCQGISDLLEADRSFPRLPIEEFLRRVGLLSARVAVELVDAPLEMGMDVATCGLCIFLRSLIQANLLLFFLSYVKLLEATFLF